MSDPGFGAPANGAAAARQPATLVVSRHGQTTFHSENRYAGSSDVDLTETGVEQAQRLARWAEMHRPEALYVSPLRRALFTAAPVTQRTGLPSRVENDLREVHFGIGEGRTIAEIRDGDARVAENFEDDPIAGSFPGSESPAAAAERGVAVLRRIAAGHPGGLVLAVTHNTLIRLALCTLLGIPLANYRRSLPQLDNGTLTALRLSGDPETPAALLSFNVPVEAVLVGT